MKRGGANFLPLIACCCLLGCCIAAPAAVAAPSRDWLTFGVGTGHRADNDEDLIFQHPSFLLGVGVQRNRHVGAVRYARIGTREAAGDLALLYGRAGAWRGVRVCGGAGVGVLFRAAERTYMVIDGMDGGGYWRQNEGFGRCGLAWSLEMVWVVDPATGLGLAAFGNLAGDRSFWGVAGVFEFGDFE